VQLDDGNTAYIFARLLQPETLPGDTVRTPVPPIAGDDEPPAATGSDTGAGSVFQDCAECPQMVVIPAGRFTMGFDAGRSEEKPAHEVEIAESFALGVYETTYAEWGVCVQEGSCRYDPADHGDSGNPQLPVSNISWDDAQNYVRWLSARTGEQYRLPSEAEWEYAARAGTSTIYWWGDEAGTNLANCQNCGSRWDNQQAAPVGSFQANPFGLYDMHGNVWEWTADCWNDSYRDAPADGTVWLKGDCLARVLRSGAWKQETDYMRAARRSWYDRDVRYYLHGMRVAKTLR
jgi:formylglycine-generating enzyme required for sulfatase activity